MDVTRCPVSVESSVPGGETNAYVLGDGPAALVDPAGRSEMLETTVAGLEIEHVLLTHTHPDHVGAAAAYADETDASVWAHRTHTTWFEATIGREPDRVLGSGTTIPLAGESIHVLETPGHARDHVSFVAGENGPILCGDCAIRDGSVVVGAPEGDMRAYVSSLRRLWARDPPRLLPGHGPSIDRPRETLERLLAHRRRRERLIETAVESDARTLTEITERAYEKDLSGVRSLARATVRAHLEKLDVEGRLEWDGQRARLDDSPRCR